MYNFRKDVWNTNDDLATELALIPHRPRRRGLVNRGMWENLRSNLLQGVLKKGIFLSKQQKSVILRTFHKIFSAAGNSLLSVIQAAKAMKEQNLHQSASTGSLSGKMMWGRLRKTPKLPAKPPIQSSESSTDDLSGSEDSSSSGLEDAEKEARNKEEESNMPQGKDGDGAHVTTLMIV